MRRGLRRFSSTLFAGLRPRTQADYSRYLAVLVLWLLRVGVFPEEGYEWDDMLVELRHGSDDAPVMSKARYEKTISAVEKVLPHVKGQLVLARAELASWRVTTKPRHAVPLLFPHACLLAHQLLLLGMPCVAATLLLQTLTGLRPGELVGLVGDHLVRRGVLPGGGSFAHLLLGPKVGTKSGRPQVVRVDNAWAIWLLERLWASVQGGEALTHLRSLGGFAYWIWRAAVAAGLQAHHWTPHSGRAGFCTWHFLHGRTAVQIMETTRHVSERSFRGYLDAQAVVAGELAQRLLLRNAEAEALMRALPEMLDRALPRVR